MVRTPRPISHVPSVRSCDVFVSLLLTKTGRFTEEELNVAHAAFIERGKPRIYTFSRTRMCEWPRWTPKTGN